MRHQSYLLVRPRPPLKGGLLALLILLNLALVAWGNDSSGNKQATSENGREAVHAVAPILGTSSVAFSLLAGAGLLIVGRARIRNSRAARSAPVADFESAYRQQHAPRVRAENLPRWRHDMLPLRRPVSRLGYDH